MTHAGCDADGMDGVSAVCVRESVSLCRLTAVGERVRDAECAHIVNLE